MTLLSIGYPQTLPTGGAGAPEVFALPARRCFLFCSTAGATLSQSSDDAFTLSVALTLPDGMEDVSGGFIRNDGVADVEVVLMPMVQ